MFCSHCFPCCAHTRAHNNSQAEIAQMQPRKICILGKTALSGLGEVEGFRELKKYAILNDCGKQLSLRGYDVVLCLFPSIQNKRYYSKSRKSLDLFEIKRVH